MALQLGSAEATDNAEGLGASLRVGADFALALSSLTFSRHKYLAQGAGRGLRAPRPEEPTQIVLDPFFYGSVNLFATLPR